MSDSVKEALVGRWTMISSEGVTKDGKTFHPFGDDPKGCIIYTENGYMSAHLMRPNRPHLPVDTFQEISPYKFVESIKGYFSYFGTYTIQEEETTVTHHVEGAIHPNWVGTTQVRSYQFEGDHLTLSADLPTSTQTVVWEKAK